MKQVIRVNDALDMVCSVAEQYSLNYKEESLLELVSLSCPELVVDNEVFIEKESLVQFCQNFIKAIREGDNSFLYRARGYKTPPVDIEEFLESPSYMNLKGFIRPTIKYELQRLFDNPNYLEVVLTGAPGIGKSVFAEMAIDYSIYKLSCLHNPQAEFDLAPGSAIVFVIQSVSISTARRAIFNEMYSRLLQSPYFRKAFPFNEKVASELRFPQHLFVIPVSSTEMAALGQNVYGGVITEANFMDVVEDSKQAYGRAEGTTYDQAARNYAALQSRMKSRFMDKGKVPGHIILDSATNYPGDFLSRKEAEAKKDESIFVMRKTLWEALGAEKFSDSFFLVEVGTADRQSRLIAHENMAAPGSQTIKVPMDLLKDFQKDCEGALRNYAGLVIASEGAFITNRSTITRAIEEHELLFQGHKLFNRDSIIIDEVLSPIAPSWEDLIDLEYLRSPSFDETLMFAMHIDLGISKDPAGLVVGHVIDYKEMPSTSCYSDKLGAFVDLKSLSAPVFCLDGILQIRPPYGGEIHLDLVRGFCFYLCGILNIKIATLDIKESAMFMQGFRRLRVRSGRVSTVISSVPYMEWKLAYMEDRIIHPRHDIYQNEAVNLQYDPKKDEIDHAPGLHNDLTDAAASVVHILQHKIAKYSRSKVVDEARTAAEKESRIRALRVKGSVSNLAGRMRFK